MKQIHSLNLSGLSILLYLKHFWLSFLASYSKNIVSPDMLQEAEFSEDGDFHMFFNICLFFPQDPAFRVMWACEKISTSM